MSCFGCLRHKCIPGKQEGSLFEHEESETVTTMIYRYSVRLRQAGLGQIGEGAVMGTESWGALRRVVPLRV